ncbi:hypothetical protein ACQ7HM_03470 [Williamsia sp. MIQD14]|uniref:hypothetical protein n=1 Tax=Williamsia sp. MIQD14 TaxID=3425703 RepID=UPI003DA16E06
MLDESLLHEVRQTLAAAGVTDCAAFVLVELNEGGLRTAVVDASTGASLVERGDGKLCPRMLDLSMADHLVRTGRVERPASFDWATELIDLMPDIRARLAVTDGAFAMGSSHVAMFRVSRRDYYAGLQPHLLAAQSLWQAVALDSTPPVGALVFMPEHEQWPGLFPTLTHLAPIPAVALRDPGPDTATPAVGARRHEDPEPVPAPPVANPLPPAGRPVPLPVTATPAPVPVPVAPSPSLPDRSSPPVPPPIEVLPAPSGHRGHAVEQGHDSLLPGARLPTGTFLPDPSPYALAGATGEQDVYQPADLGERTPAPVRENPDVMHAPGPRHYTPPAHQTRTSVDGAPVDHRRVFIGVAAVIGAAVVGGLIVGLSWLGGDSDSPRPETAAAQGMVAQTSSVPVSPAPTSRPPLDTRSAQAPLLRYTAPPPVTAAPTAQPSGPTRRAAPPPPRRRSIPNPIPGLPPILLP